VDIRVYSKRGIDFLHVLYFRKSMQWVNWLRLAERIPPEHDGNSKIKPGSHHPLSYAANKSHQANYI